MQERGNRAATEPNLTSASKDEPALISVLRNNPDVRVQVDLLRLRNHRPSDPSRYGKDLELIWEHLLGDLTVALLKKTSKKTIISPSARERISDALPEHFDRLHLAYLKWRKGNPRRDVGIFLLKSQKFQLPKFRRGDSPMYGSLAPQERVEKEILIVLNYEGLLQELKAAGLSRRLGRLSWKKKLRAAVTEAWGVTELPEKNLLHLRSESRAQIAIEVTAWKHNLKPITLERNLSRLRKRFAGHRILSDMSRVRNAPSNIVEVMAHRRITLFCERIRNAE